MQFQYTSVTLIPATVALLVSARAEAVLVVRSGLPVAVVVVVVVGSL